MNLPLPWPFDRDYMQLALVAGLVVGACAPLIGTFLVQKRMSLMGDGIGHVAFAGVSAGLIFGVWPVWTALAAAVAGAMVIEWLRSRRRASGDLALAVLFYSGIAGGVVLTGLAGSFDAGTLTYLFGSILTVTRTDSLTIAGLGVVILCAVWVAWRALFAVIVDEEAGRVAGLPVDGLNQGLAVLTAVTVVAGMRVVGILLVAALMVLPVGAAQRVSRSFRATLATASAIGCFCAVCGLAAARLWGLAPGGTIVLVAGACFVGAMAWPAGGRSRLHLAASPGHH